MRLSRIPLLAVVAIGSLRADSFQIPAWVASTGDNSTGSFKLMALVRMTVELDGNYQARFANEFDISPLPANITIDKALLRLDPMGPFGKKSSMDAYAYIGDGKIADADLTAGNKIATSTDRFDTDTDVTSIVKTAYKNGDDYVGFNFRETINGTTTQYPYLDEDFASRTQILTIMFTRNPPAKTPEPSTAILLGSGVVFFLLHRRRLGVDRNQ